MEFEFRDEAMSYRERGFSVIPISCKGSKKTPIVRWNKWTEELPDMSQVETWWSDFPDAGVGIITGEVSGLIVLDIDQPLTGVSLDLPDTDMASATVNGGWHLYYSYVKGPRSRVPAEYFSLRSNGSYVVAPPTTGYVWTSEGQPGIVTAADIEKAMKGLAAC